MLKKKVQCGTNECVKSVNMSNKSDDHHEEMDETN